MKINQAKAYFELGIITKFYAVRDIEPGCWILCIEGQQDKNWTLQTALGKTKVFATLDTLTREIETIMGSHVSSIAFAI
ncbi:hypothetical protein [Sulfuriferula nivalis]|uniref:Uncharacterized protein n=1 Tax=Sulfuriferula nivalis TaxID=2675298 RepID=A0A809SB62_9PROT|nr:hypothetical protein [Sulfuriferula nivalis]BBP02503.1 hypothetical protein SFSGTM_32110 [Sulfuriferula nivalis]